METELKTYKINDVEFRFHDIKGSITVDFVMSDIATDAYGLSELPDDQSIILDCGAHVGTIAIYLAKRFPKAKVLAIEPFPLNYENLLKNIKENDVTNVYALNFGLSGDGKPIGLTAEMHNTGSANQQYECEHNIETTTLDTLFKFAIPENEIVSFLKMDIERAEYETLWAFTKWDRVKDLSVEIHDRPDCLKPNEGWLDKILDFEAWLKTKPILGKLWTPAHELYER